MIFKYIKATFSIIGVLIMSFTPLCELILFDSTGISLRFFPYKGFRGIEKALSLRTYDFLFAVIN